ncbi:hypothetical protein FKP32DRAFT_1588987 [Trametes sanguinea]|nr:hypothetical protein FKP32DRAFT_1588987 [Trametes sanguinea]
MPNAPNSPAELPAGSPRPRERKNMNIPPPSQPDSESTRWPGVPLYKPRLAYVTVSRVRMSWGLRPVSRP